MIAGRCEFDILCLSWPSEAGGVPRTLCQHMSTMLAMSMFRYAQHHVVGCISLWYSIKHDHFWSNLIV